MPRRLPPLNALRAFEAAARHLNFTRAANELCVTQGAVSRQVKLLEEFLDIDLLRRTNRTLTLTDEGAAYMASLGKAFDIVEGATLRLPTRSDRILLTVRLLPTLAMRWLIPRLHEFNKSNPDIEVRITTSLRPADFTKDDVDVAIGRKPDRGPNLHIDLIMAEDLVVVCSPALLDGKHPIGQPADLVNQNLLHAATRPEAWQIWLKGAGLSAIVAERGLKFEHYYFAIQAAIGGLGVVVAPRPLVIDDLASGQLIAPFDISVPSDDNYYLIYPASHSQLPKLQAFRMWILALTGNRDSRLKLSM